MRECVQELLQEVARRVVGQRTARVEELGGFANVGLGLRHRRHVEEYERLPQMVVRAERANRSGRNADDRPGLAAPCAVSVRARADVDRVLEHAGHAAVVLGCHEEHCISLPDARLERRSGSGRIGVVVLVVERQLPDFDDFELERRRRNGDQCLGGLAVEGFLTQAADENGDVTGRAHELPFWASVRMRLPTAGSQTSLIIETAESGAGCA